MVANRPRVDEMLTRETGKPYKESIDEASWSASATDYYAEVARHEAGRVLGSAVDGQIHFTTKDPLGVVVRDLAGPRVQVGRVGPASRMRCSVSSSVEPAATTPGRSGLYAE